MDRGPEGQQATCIVVVEVVPCRRRENTNRSAAIPAVPELARGKGAAKPNSVILSLPPNLIINYRKRIKLDAKENHCCQ